ncbi:hypothetical protein BJF78_32050 [Pseudonocardia sp. CNS-139]|nr:hypothetical protein BJF78_32050 [Pseudonocardia sp. CNS-139]
MSVREGGASGLPARADVVPVRLGLSATDWLWRVARWAFTLAGAWWCCGSARRSWRRRLRPRP